MGHRERKSKGKKGWMVDVWWLVVGGGSLQKKKKRKSEGERMLNSA